MRGIIRRTAWIACGLLVCTAGQAQEVTREEQTQSLEVIRSGDKARIIKPERQAPQPETGTGPSPPKRAPVRRVSSAALLARGWQQYGNRDYQAALALFKRALRSAARRDTQQQARLGLGYTFLKLEEPESARPYFEELVEQGYRLEETAPALVDLLLTVNDLPSAEAYLDRIPADKRDTWQRQVSLRRLRHELAGHGPDAPAYRDILGRILAIAPDDTAARSELAWLLYNAGEYRQALDHFTRRQQLAPDHDKYLLGRCLSLQRLGRLEEALDLLEQRPAGTAGDDELRAPANQLRLAVGWQAYDSNDFARAATLAQRVLDNKPDNRQAAELLAWSRDRLGLYRDAAAFFLTEYNRSKSVAAADNLLRLYEKAGAGKEAFQFTARLGQEGDQTLKRFAADRYYRQGYPLRAAQAYRGLDSPYSGWAEPWLEDAAVFRRRSGDDGLSRLDQAKLLIKGHYPVAHGRQWHVSLAASRLDAHAAPSPPPAGSFFRFINENRQERALVTSLRGLEPEIGMSAEGWPCWSVYLGLTPLGEEVPAAPMPTLRARLFQKEKWYIDLHQEPVRESILSYAGQEDPYGAEEWGRVLRSGLHGGRTFALAPACWLSGAVGYDYYWGKNIADNHAVFGTLSVGRSSKAGEGIFSRGLFLTAQHFDSNSGFFTFGHGGYFSPDLFAIIGPFVRYRATERPDLHLDVQASLGLMHYSTADAPRYHKVNAAGAPLSAAARQELAGQYQGEDKTAAGASIKAEALKLVSGHVALGGFLHLNTASNFDEWQAGAVLHYYFTPRTMLSPGDNPAGIFSVVP